MKKQRKDSIRTRKQLLAASYGLFCEKGFRDTTIAEICSLAGANVAAVNYHFGNKESLYKEAWLHTFNESLKEFPIDGGVPEGAAPEERLRGYIRSIVYRIVAKTSDLTILHKEMANPTGLLAEIMTEKIRMQFEVGKGIVRALLGEAATEQRVLFCHTSILGQCFHLGATRHRDTDRMSPPDLITDIDAYCDHVVNFSLAAIRTLSKGAAVSENDEKTMQGDL